MIGIINYGMGNTGSLARKLELLKVKHIISDKTEELEICDKLILPGVGHFARAVTELKSKKLWDFLEKQIIIKCKPILGICLGMQLMCNKSEEGEESGFGWFDANVVKFTIKNTQMYKVPHIGWNTISIEKNSALFDGISLRNGFYFVHSFHIICKNEKDIINKTNYEYSFVSGIQRDNIYGLQYHPEKSHDEGEKLLKNFVNLI